MRLACALLVLSGCAGDPCPSLGGQSCIALQVRWAGSSRLVDQLEVRALEGFTLASARTPPVAGNPFALPALVPIGVGPLAGGFRLGVVALRDGLEIGGGETSGNLERGEHRRFTVELTAGEALDGGTPTLTSFAITSQFSVVEENGSFAVHLVALDQRGEMLSSYNRVPTLSTDWGEIVVRSPPSFIGGEADATVALTRETNPNNAVAHVIASDGEVANQSGALFVVAPNWQLQNAVVFAVEPGSWDEMSINFPSWTRKDGRYYMFYQGRDAAGAAGWGTAVSRDALLWSRALTPNLTPLVGGWDAGKTIAAWKGTWDGARFVAAYTVDTGVGFATSVDGVTFVRGAGPSASGTSTLCPYQAFARALTVEVDQLRVYMDQPNGPCWMRSLDGGTTWSSPAPTSGFPINFPSQVVAVIQQGGVYRMWYQITSGGSATGYATSSDGVNWAISPSSPVGVRLETVVWNESVEVFEALIVDGATEILRATRP